MNDQQGSLQQKFRFASVSSVESTAPYLPEIEVRDCMESLQNTQRNCNNRASMRRAGARVRDALGHIVRRYSRRRNRADGGWRQENSWESFWTYRSVLPSFTTEELAFQLDSAPVVSAERRDRRDCSDTLVLQSNLE